LIVAVAAATQGTGLDCAAHAVTSLPPIETVTSETWPRWRRRKRSAAVACVLLYVGPSSARAFFAQPLDSMIDSVVAPPQPKLTSLSL
jgi:hypothetical protein